MLTIAIFTYKRIHLLNKCLKSLNSKYISEILIFNDDEKFLLNIEALNVDKNFISLIKIFNPQDFGFSNRNFRKPIYLNKAVEIAVNELILFSDDDGIFNQGAIDKHYNALKTYHFSVGGIVRSRFINRISKTILQGTNYAFRKSFYNSVCKYDENFVKSMGGGDIDFWYRIYNYTKKNNLSVAFLPNAIQRVNSNSKRKKIFLDMDAREYTNKKHQLSLKGPMYKWFGYIRDKSLWMKILN
tara:strand:+ start:355 stop:1080 length:726 start_codon:yes stop_codon:yes gene_type:complete